jgi:hypothetical protein
MKRVRATDFGLPASGMVVVAPEVRRPTPEAGPAQPPDIAEP